MLIPDLFALDAQMQQKAIDLADYLARIAAALLALWGAAEKVVKPLMEWRTKQRTEREASIVTRVRTILEPELSKLDRLGVCTDRLEVVLNRQTEIFTEFDHVLKVVTNNSERIDETNELLDAIGLKSTDRRNDDNAERRHFEEIMDALRARSRDRRRHDAEARGITTVVVTATTEKKTP